MEIGPVGPTGNRVLADGNTQSGQTENTQAFRLVRQLRDLNIADREFDVVRDPASHRFVVRVVERSTGTVLDQFPPESVLKMISQLQAWTAHEGDNV